MEVRASATMPTRKRSNLRKGVHPMKISLVFVALAALAGLAPAQRVIVQGGQGTGGGGMERYRGQRMRVFLDGRQIQLRTDPIVHGDELYVPIRGIFERFGARLTYNSRAKRVTARRGRRSVVARVGTKLAQVNGENRLLDAPPMIRNRQLLIPFRFFADALGAGVIWRPDQNRLDIVSNRRGAGAGS